MSGNDTESSPVPSPSTTAPPTSTAAATSSAAATTTDPTTLTSEPPDPKENFKPYIVGIIVGVVLLILVMIVIIHCYKIRKRRKTKKPMMPAKQDKFKRGPTFFRRAKQRLEDRWSKALSRSPDHEGNRIENSIDDHPDPPPEPAGQRLNDYGTSPKPNPSPTKPRTGVRVLPTSTSDHSYQNSGMDVEDLDQPMDPPPTPCPSAGDPRYVNIPENGDQDHGYVNTEFHKPETTSQIIKNITNGIISPDEATGIRYANDRVSEHTIPEPTSSGSMDPFYVNSGPLSGNELYENGALATEQQQQQTGYVQKMF